MNSNRLLQGSGLNPVENDIFSNNTLGDVLLRGDSVHQVEHQLFEDNPQATSADIAFLGFPSDRRQGVVGELKRRGMT